MPRHGRFEMAARVLSALASHRPRALTSAELAAEAGGHPVVVRRLLGKLGRAGITISKSGKDGGARLAMAPKRVTLRAVYEAVEPPPAISGSLEKPLRRAERAYLKALEETTLKDIAGRRAVVPAPAPQSQALDPLRPPP